MSRLPPVDRLRYDTISFLSDYGTTDEFVGVVKSVIRQIAPGVGVVDVTHEVPPHDVRAGGLAWPGPRSTCAPASCWRWSTPAWAPSAGPWRSRSATARPC